MPHRPTKILKKLGLKHSVLVLLSNHSEPRSMQYVQEVTSGADVVAVVVKATGDSETYHFGELLELPQISQVFSSHVH